MPELCALETHSKSKVMVDVVMLRQSALVERVGFRASDFAEKDYEIIHCSL